MNTIRYCYYVNTTELLNSLDNSATTTSLDEDEVLTVLLPLSFFLKCIPKHWKV